MAQQPLSVDLKDLILRMFFKGEPGPENLWVGLSSAEVQTDDDTGLPELMTLEELEADELIAPAYERMRLLPANWQVERNGLTVSVLNEQVAFGNTSEERWPPIRSAFISTIAAKGGILVGWSGLEFAPQILTPGSVMELPIEFSY